MRWILCLFCLGLFLIPAMAQDGDASACKIDVEGLTGLLESAQANVETDRSATMTALNSLRDEIQHLIKLCDDSPAKSINLTLQDASIQMDYPADWALKQDNDSGYFLSNTPAVLERDLFGSEPPAMNSGEVLIYVTLTPPDIFETDSTDMLDRMREVVAMLADTFSEASEPTLIENDLYTIGQVRFYMPTVWASITAVELGQDNLLAVFIELSAPSELRDWDETLNSMFNSIKLVELKSNADE